MVTIVDSFRSSQAIKLREALFDEMIPCALCDTEKLREFNPQPVTVCFAVSEREISAAVSYVPAESVICANTSSKRLYYPGVTILEPGIEGLVEEIRKRALRRAGIIPEDFTAGNVHIWRGEVYYRGRYLALTPTEKMITRFLAFNRDRYFRETEIKRYAFRDVDLRKKGTAVSVHIANINSKSRRAAESDAIVCRRNSGYVVLSEEVVEVKRRSKPGFTPPFV